MLDDALYLRSVVDIIADTSRPSIHCLVDAYATFVNRVRSQAHLLDTAHLAAIDPIRTHRANVVRALRRDVRLAHLDVAHESAVSLDSKQYAREASSLCQHALCVLATIFRFPVFHAAFLEHDLSMLFGDVLDIALADRLPLNGAKTYSLSLWALSRHRLPLTVLGSRQDDLFIVLQRSLDAASRPQDVVLDALEAISHTIGRHPSDLLFPLLPQVIANLDCKSPEHRLHASIALGNFANALVHPSVFSPTMWHSLSDHVMSFLEYHSRVSSGHTTFSAMLRDAFSAGSHALSPTRILAVLASLIVLCGPTLYRKPAVLHFILQSLGAALAHKRSVVRALHPHVWRCFVWTFSQMLSTSENVEPAWISSAFYVIKQEVRGGIGTALVSVLLSDRISTIQRGNRVSQALSVIRSMAQTECKHTCREGFMFLQAFTNDAQVRHQIAEATYETPASVLLNGAIIRAEWDSLPSIIHSIPKVSVSVYWLEETEIAQHYETLLEIWKHFACKTGKSDLDSALIDVWKSILLACSHQLECGQYITEKTQVLRCTAAMIVEFLPPVASGDCQPDWGSWDVHDQLSTLTFIDQLWSAMRNAFVAFSLAEAAELILASILKYAFHVLDFGVRTLWSRLCANLMITTSPSFLRDMHDLPESRLRGQRELWGVVATSLSSSELSLDWKELAKFLAIPICTWVLSEPELEGWEALLRNAITISGDPATTIQHFVSKYLVRKDIETWDSTVVVLGFLLTHAREYPTDEFLSTVDVCLIACYSHARHSPEALTHSLKLLDAIRHVITSTPGDVMHIVRAISSSLCLWIEDHAEVMSDDEFNSVAVSLYCEVLKALELLPLSIQSLQDTENFLASAFSRIPTPAVAPFAFENFWRATYHGRREFCNILPSKIKSCLASFVAAYGGDLANGLSLTTDSQSQSVSNNASLRSPASQQHRDTKISIPIGAEARIQSFLTSDDAPLPVVLRELQQYTSQIEASLDDPGRLRLLSPTSLPSSVIQKSPEKFHSGVSNVPNQKRKFAESDDAPEKRSRITRDTLRFMRKLESEPATRDVTPLNIPRMGSAPLKERRAFDGVHVLTYHEVSRRRKLAQGAECANDATSNTRRGAPASQTPPSLCERRGTTYTSDGSDEEDADWENFYIDMTSSEADIDRSLVNVLPSSLPPSRTSTPHDPKVSCLASGSSPSKVASQSECSPSPSVHPSLPRVKTTSAGLDALQDVYSSVVNGASQIPLSQLFQATKLVHQIGAALAEQIGKKMSKPG